VERFEAWALELIGEAVSSRFSGEERRLGVVGRTGVQADDR
jgi:hypothetical protein